jgi:arylsulfatase A-like enzyme
MFGRRASAILLGTVILTLWAGPLFAASKPDIVLITLSSVRVDRMGFLGSSKKLTPNLDGVARQSLIFERAFAQAPLTVVSHATILTGAYPQTDSVTELGAALPPSVPFLPDILRAHGYRTAAFVGSIKLDPRNGFAPGFDRGFTLYNAGFRQPAKGLSRYQSVERHGTQVVDRTIAWLAANSKAPFFLWVHLNDADVASATAYDHGVAADDFAVGKLLAFLRARRLYDSALIVIASDHGESLGAHGEQTHGVFLYDETTHVPLLLKLPENQTAGRQIRANVGLIDVAPTILEVARIPVPSQMQGQSLLRIARGGSEEPVYSRTDLPQRAFGWSALQSWRAGKYLYIRAPKPELYDLAADPGESRNLAQTSKATLETMAAQLASFDARLSGQVTASTAKLSSSEMQKLASLGYVGLQQASGTSTAATGIDPKDDIAPANEVLAALALIDDGKPENALSRLKPLAEAGSKMYLAQYAMGAALAEEGHCSQAIKYLHNAIELQPDSAWAHYEMGSCLMKTGDYKSAAVHLQIAARRLPEFADAHTLLAQADQHLRGSGENKRPSSEPKAKP